MRRVWPSLARWMPGLFGLVLFGLILFAYVPFLGAGFAATDSLPLVETSRISNLGDAARLFAGPVMAGTRFAQVEVVYRPFVSLTFGLDHLLWGLDPIGYHATNLALHMAAVLAVWFLGRGLGLTWWASLAGAAVFALHPLVLASVPVIARRDSILPVAAYTAAAACVLASDRSCGRRATWLQVLGAMLLAIALLSKESAFAALVMLPMLLVARRFGGGDPFLPSVWAAIRVCLPLVPLALIIFVIRWSILGGLGGQTGGANSLGVDFDRYGQIVGAFTRDLLWPFAGVAASTRDIWPRLALALLICVAIGLGCLPRRPATVAAAGLLWTVGFGLFCVVLKIGTIAWLAYFSLVGVGLLFGGTLEGALERVRHPTPPSTRPGQVTRVVSAGLLVGLAVYASSLLWASSLVRRYDQWQIAGQVTQRYADALTACLADAPTARRLNLNALPSSLDDGRVETSLLGVTLLEDWTIESLLRVMAPERRLDVHVSSWATVRGTADTLNFTCTPGGDTVELTTTYLPA